MNDHVSLRQTFKHLLAIFETISAQNGAIAAILRDKKIMTQDEFAAYVKRVDDASRAHWDALRGMVDRLPD